MVTALTVARLVKMVTALPIALPAFKRAVRN